MSALIPNVTKVVVFEDSICSAQVIGDHVRFEGHARGTTPVFIWQGEKQNIIVIHVIEEQESGPKRTLQRRQDGKANGVLSTTVQMTDQNNRLQQILVANQLDWNEEIGKNRLRVAVEGESGPTFQSERTSYNVRTTSLQYVTPKFTLTLLDSAVDVGGGIRSHMTPYLTSNTLLLRGASFQTQLMQGALTLFAGATLPSRFSYYGGTRDVAGAVWRNAFSQRMQFSVTAAVTSIPTRQSNGVFHRAISSYGLASLQARVAQSVQLEAVAGVSNKGGLVQGAVSYSNSSLTAFATATYSALSFPLNQLRLLPAGHGTASGGGTLRISPRFTATLFLQHTSTQDGVLLDAGGSSQHINSSLTFAVNQRNNLTLNYVFDRTTGSLQSASRSIGNRAAMEWSGQFGKAFANTVRVTKGALSDPFEANSRDSFSIHEFANWRPQSNRSLKGLTFLFAYDRANTSLAAKLSQDLLLLTPSLQQIYYLDPVGFLQQQNLPPGLLNLIENLRPSSVSFELDGQLSFGTRLNLSPVLSYVASVASLSSRSQVPTFGFHADYLIRPDLTLRVNLNNSYLLAAGALGSLQRATTLSFGLTQSLRGFPHWATRLSGTRGTILGRVYRDTDGNGLAHPGKSGLAGLQVVLSNGIETYTDAQGRYRFDKLTLGEYTVRLPLSQFSRPIRLTTAAERKSDLRIFRTVQTDFGIIDFSRVQGSVYNDYLGAGYREPDAPGVAEVRVFLVGEKGKWEQICDASGEFEFNNVDPGVYTLSIDPATVPDNFEPGKFADQVVVRSATTITIDVPVNALRSIQGTVLCRVNGKEQPVPTAGVRVSVGGKIAITNGEGVFLIRGLPAGDLPLTLVPTAPLPPGKIAPGGTIQLSRGPMEGRGIRVVLSQEDLAYYLNKPLPNYGKPKR